MKFIKKILLVGEFNPDSSVYTYASSFSNVLNKHGYEVKRFNCKKSYVPAFGEMIYDMPWYLHKLNNLLCNYSLKKVSLGFKPDLIFVIKGDNVFLETISYIKKYTDALFVNFYPDNPFVFWNGNSNAEVLKSLPLYDHFLIWSEVLMPNLQAAGCENVSYFPFAYDKELFPEDVLIDEADKDRYSSDVCFVGTWDFEREAWLEKLCGRMPGLDLAIWGNMWDERLPKGSALRDKLRGTAIYGEKMIKAFRLSKIVLNFIRKQNITSHNMRTMEVLASKGFLLTGYTDEQARLLFKDNEDLVCFDNLGSLVSKIKYYLEHDLERKNIIESGYKSVQKYELDGSLPPVIETIQEINV